jgi:hypothetical protein
MPAGFARSDDQPDDDPAQDLGDDLGDPEPVDWRLERPVEPAVEPNPSDGG